MKIVEPSVELLWSTPKAEKIIENAGRTCYKSESKVFNDCLKCKGTGKQNLEIELISSMSNKSIGTRELEYCKVECSECSERSTREFIRKVLKSGHESIIEHASASFRIICDRGITHEFVRHRLFSYSQESSRYCNYAGDKFGNEITVIKPSNLKCYASWEIAMRNAEETYLFMIKMGDSPQVARSVLPTCLKTELIATTNFRSWRNFLKLRLDKAAHPDIIVVAKMICRELKKVAPTVFEEFQCEN